MTLSRAMRLVISVVLPAAIGARALDGGADSGLSVTTTVSAEFGQAVKYYFRNTQTDLYRQWLTSSKLKVQLDRRILPHLKGEAGIEGVMWFDAFPLNLNTSFGLGTVARTAHVDFHLDKADVAYTRGVGKGILLEARLGYFPFKYNPDARDLGEYLFRTGTYPAFVITSFDYPQARLLGIDLKNGIGDVVTHHLLLTSETDIPPLNDFSLTWLFDANIKRIVSVGGGAQWYRLLPVNDTFTVSSEFKNARSRYVVVTDSSTMKGDTGYYPLSGLKLMARLSFDPKRLFIDPGRSGFFRKSEDGKIYAEAAILGVKSYPADITTNPYGYDTLRQKIPVTVGIDVPTHPLCAYGALAAVEALSYVKGFFRDRLGIPTSPAAAGAFAVFGAGSWALERFCHLDTRLDLLALELEWYGCPYPNSYQDLAKSPVSAPSAKRSIPDREALYSQEDNWKWSIHAKKTFGAGGRDFSVIGQVARDHLRLPVYFSEAIDREDALEAHDHWYWMLKAECDF